MTVSKKLRTEYIIELEDHRFDLIGCTLYDDRYILLDYDFENDCSVLDVFDNKQKYFNVKDFNSIAIVTESWILMNRDLVII